MYQITAHIFIKDNKYTTSNQFTVPQLPTGGYDDLLTEKGIQTLDECLKAVNENQFKDTFISWEWDHMLSGSWFEPNHLIDPIVQARGYLNARNNRVIVGILESNTEKIIQTSFVRFWGDGWCQTISGSLYRIPSTAKGPGNGSPLLINKVW